MFTRSIPKRITSECHNWIKMLRIPPRSFDFSKLENIAFELRKLLMFRSVEREKVFPALTWGSSTGTFNQMTEQKKLSERGWNDAGADESDEFFPCGCLKSFTFPQWSRLHDASRHFKSFRHQFGVNSPSPLLSLLKIHEPPRHYPLTKEIFSSFRMLRFIIFSV